MRVMGRRWTLAAGLAGALFGAAMPASAATSPSATKLCVPAEREHPDLGIVRHHDPQCPRTLHLGMDLGGVVLPAGLGPLDHQVWTLRGGPAWAIRVAPWLSFGGRHGITLYDAATIRVRVHDHQVETAAHPLVQAGVGRVHDRLVLGVETHSLFEAKVGEASFRLGGVRDVVGYVGYGIEHTLAPRWSLGWQAHFRHAWVFRDTQRQVRAAVRVAFLPRPAHRLALELTGFFVDRKPDQGGVDVPRRGVYGSVAGEYAWMSRAGVGPMLRARYTTGFLAGEAPIYEIRNESLQTHFADLTLGLRARW
jgi:hypothetical protein